MADNQNSLVINGNTFVFPAMDILKGTDLAALHASIVATLSAAFEGVHFEFYREERKSLPFGTGATGQPPRAYVLMQLTEMEAGELDPGTDQLAMVARFDAEIVIKSLQAESCLLVRTLAGAIAAFLRKQMRWPYVLNGPINVAGCYKDDFSPELDQYEVWRVEWSQDIWLGDVSEVLPPMPTTPLYSYSPLIGVPYVDEYTPLEVYSE